MFTFQKQAKCANTINNIYKAHPNILEVLLFRRSKYYYLLGIYLLFIKYIKVTVKISKVNINVECFKQAFPLKYIISIFK